MIGYTLQVVALGAVLIGFIAGVLSVFFVSRRQSLLADAISHSTLAGITLSYLLLGEAHRLGLLAGALLTGLVGVALIQLITTYTDLKDDAAIGIVLSLLFGTGVALLSMLQRQQGGGQTGLKHYLFGNIAFLRRGDLVDILLLGLVVLVPITLFWKELKLISFDAGYAKTMGLPVSRYEWLVLAMVVTTVIIGVELIGVVMMAGLLIAPGIAARQWSNVFGRVVLLSGLLGALAGAGGAVLSGLVPSTPAGPAIIVILGSLVLVSIGLSRNGAVWAWLNYLRLRLQYDVRESLEHLTAHMMIDPRACDIREFAVAEEQDDPRRRRDHRLQDDLKVLLQLGYIRPREGGNWILTLKGMEMVDQLGRRLEVAA